MEARYHIDQMVETRDRHFGVVVFVGGTYFNWTYVVRINGIERTYRECDLRAF